MTFKQLLYVIEIAKVNSISQAAERLYVSQPALSLQIKNLEQELGYAIFYRTSKGLTLTASGEYFCEQAQLVLESWSQFQRHVLPLEKRRRSLRIGLGARVYSNSLFPYIAEYFERQPEIEVAFLTEAGGDSYGALKAGTMDIALDRMPESEILGEGSICEATELIREEQCVLMAAGHPLSQKKVIHLSDLQNVTIATGLEDSVEDRLLKKECMEQGIMIQRFWRSDSIETLMSMVQSGRGVVIGPRSFADYYGVQAVPFYPKRQDSLYFVCLKKQAKQPEIHDFQRYLKGLCRKKNE